MIFRDACFFYMISSYVILIFCSSRHHGTSIYGKAMAKANMHYDAQVPSVCSEMTRTSGLRTFFLRSLLLFAL